MIGANGRCKDHDNQFVHEDSYLCFKHRKSEYGEYIDQKTPCGECKSFKRIQTGKIIRFDEPYVWKQFKVGSYYNYTRLDFRSYLKGQSFKYDYTYIGVI